MCSEENKHHMENTLGDLLALAMEVRRANV